MKVPDAERIAIAALIMKMRAQGMSDPRLLGAMETVPRRLFVPARYHEDAYADRAVPIECGQTLGAPSTVATVLGAASVQPGHSVLEVGCGSGYQAAVLAAVGARVVTVDRYRTLVDLAVDRFQSLRLSVTALVADGLEGHAAGAPFDRIVVDGAVGRVPAVLLDQLAEGGILVAPVGTGPHQALVRIVRDGRLFNRTEVATVRFVPLVEGVARRL
jgi:protein-L-isoaspartate(D-aspartate) O-methyltransferase